MMLIARAFWSVRCPVLGLNILKTPVWKLTKRYCYTFFYMFSLSACAQSSVQGTWENQRTCEVNTMGENSFFLHVASELFQFTILNLSG